MKLLDKHLLKEVLGPFLFGVAAFTSLFFAGKNLLDLTTYVMNGLPVTTAALLVLLTLPGVIVLTLPMSALLAVLLGFGRLSGDSEVVSLFAGGVSIYRCALPIAALGLAVSIASFCVNEFIVPPASDLAKQMTLEAVKQVKAPKEFSYVDSKDGITNMIMVKGGIDIRGKTKMMHDVFVTQLREGKATMFFRAKEAIWRGGDEWELQDGYFKNLDITRTDIPESGQFKEMKTMIIHVNKNPRQIALAAKKPDEMSISELREHIGAMKEAHAEIGKLEVGYWQKFALPLASLVFALLGTPLGIRPHRTSSSMGLGLSIFIILLFWLTYHYTTALAVQGQIPASVGAFIPDVIGIGAACLLLMKAAK